MTARPTSAFGPDPENAGLNASSTVWVSPDRVVVSGFFSIVNSLTDILHFRPLLYAEILLLPHLNRLHPLQGLVH